MALDDFAWRLSDQIIDKLMREKGLLFYSSATVSGYDKVLEYVSEIHAKLGEPSVDKLSADVNDIGNDFYKVRIFVKH